MKIFQKYTKLIVGNKATIPHKQKINHNKPLKLIPKIKISIKNIIIFNKEIVSLRLRSQRSLKSQMMNKIKALRMKANKSQRPSLSKIPILVLDRIGS